MKKYIQLISVSFLLSGSLFAQHDHGDHDHKDHVHGGPQEKAIAAPNGGRLIHEVEPHLEFLLLEDRHVQISAVDDAGKPVAINEQQASLIGGDRSNAVRISFVKDGEVLRSSEALPDFPGMPIILQIQSTADAPTIREKFYLKTHICGGCDLSEYACTCGH